MSFLSRGFGEVLVRVAPWSARSCDLCGPEDLVSCSSHLPGRLLDLLPGKQTWEIGRERGWGKNEQLQMASTSPKHAITFQVGYLQLVRWGLRGVGSVQAGNGQGSQLRKGASGLALSGPETGVGQLGTGREQQRGLRSSSLQGPNSSPSCPCPPRRSPSQAFTYSHPPSPSSGPQLTVHRPWLPGPLLSPLF